MSHWEPERTLPKRTVWAHFVPFLRQTYGGVLHGGQATYGAGGSEIRPAAEWQFQRNSANSRLWNIHGVVCLCLCLSLWLCLCLCPCFCLCFCLCSCLCLASALAYLSGSDRRHVSASGSSLTAVSAQLLPIAVHSGLESHFTCSTWEQSNGAVFLIN